MLDVLASLWWIVIPIIIFIIGIIVAFSLYTMVPANVAHVVVQHGRMRTFSSHPDYGSEILEKDEEGNPLRTKSAYFKIPSFIPGYGMVVHQMPLKVITISVKDFLAFDSNRARFECDIRTYVVIKDVVKSAKRFPMGIDELKEQVANQIWATTRDCTTKKTIREIINDREGIINQIRRPLSEAISIYGLGLEDIELIEFKDPTKPIPGVKEQPHVITDISSIEEVKINSEARQKNAEEIKEAKLKEAIADEIAQTREIQRDEVVAKRKQLKLQEVAKEEKKTMEETLEVTKVEKVKNQEIEKSKAEVLAEQEKVVARIDAEKRKDVEAINKEQKHLEGTGDRLRREEQAKGEAAPIRETGTAEAKVIELKYLAEAKGKDELQKALNKFTDQALEAYVAKEIVEKDKAIGIAGAEALKYADVRAFLGGGDGKGTDGSQSAFDIGKALQSMVISNQAAGASFLNRIAQPNDLGFHKQDYKKLMAIIDQTPELKEKIREAIDKAEEEQKKVKEAMNSEDDWKQSEFSKKISELDDVIKEKSGQAQRKIQDFKEKAQEKIEDIDKAKWLDDMQDNQDTKQSKTKKRKRM